MKKYLIFTVLFMTVITLLGINVEAKTNEEIEAILDTIPNTREESGEYYIDLPMVDFSELEANSLLTLDTIDAYCAEAICYGGDTKEEKINAINSSIKQTIESGAITVYLKNLGIEEAGYVEVDTTNKTITFKNGSNNYSIVRTYNYTTVANPDANIQNQANNITKQLDLNYTVRDMAYVSALYHYGSWSSIIDDGDNALFIYQDFKKVIERNPGFQYKVNSDEGGDSPEGGTASSTVFLIKNNIIYGAKFINFNMNYIIFVDKDEEGTPKEKLEKRIKDYSNGNITFDLRDDTSGYNYTYELDGVEYPVTIYWTTVNENGHNVAMPFSVIEVSNEYIKGLEISSYDANTDISMNTTGYEVPLDAKVVAEDVKDSENVKKALSSLDVISAFNIDIVGRRNNNKISKIENGVEVFIPIKGYKTGDVITVKHVKDDGTLGDELKAPVVEVDGKLYAKFTTTHFSTYALVEDTEEVPKTIDNINKYMITAVLSLSGIVGIAILRKKVMN